MLPVNVDEYLMSWGLRFRRFITTDAKNKSGASPMVENTLNIVYHRFVAYFLVAMFIRWIFVICVSFSIGDTDDYDESEGNQRFLVMGLGDFTAGVGTRFSQIFYQLEIAGLSMISLMVTGFSYKFRMREDKFFFLSMFDFMKGYVRPNNGAYSEMTELISTRLWRRTLKNLHFLYPVVRWLGIVVMSGLVVYCSLQTMTPEDIMFRMGWFWISIQIIWFYFLVTQVVGLIAVLDVICEYFGLRFAKLLADMKAISKHENDVRIELRNGYLLNMLKEFDTICSHLNKFNRFWQMVLFMLLKVGLLLVFAGFAMIVTFGEGLDWFHWWSILILTHTQIAIWWTIASIASKPANYNHNLYMALNRLCLIPVPENIQAKMENFVKRFSGPKIAFWCFRMFSISHEYMYHVLMWFGSCFILFADSARTHMNPEIRSKRVKTKGSTTTTGSSLTMDITTAGM